MIFKKVFSIVILFVFGFLPTQIFAQVNYEDVVYLKNGTIIHGMIIEQVPNESLKIKSDRNVFVFKLNEVEKITKEELKSPPAEVIPISNIPAHAHLNKARKESGYTNITEITLARNFSQTHSYYYGYYYGSEYETHFDRINNGPSFGIQTVNGYQFNPYLSVGVGIGLQGYNELFLIPVFLEVRAVVMKTRLSPFVLGEIGSSFTGQQVFGTNTEYDDEGGLMGSMAGGVKYFASDRIALNFSIGFRYQELTVENDNSDYYFPSYSKRSMNQFNIRMGITF
jgi:hypothetical protein